MPLKQKSRGRWPQCVSAVFAVALCWVAAHPVLASEAPQARPHLLTHADVLPLSLDPLIDFRKTELFFLESPEAIRIRGTEQPSIAFERKRLLFGAITPNDERARYGNYFTFFWRARRSADLTVRLEYRQEKLGPYVQAREVDYPAARPGSYRTEFAVIGDDYALDGRVSAWRALLIEHPGGATPRIVALTQSYLWR